VCVYTDDHDSGRSPTAVTPSRVRLRAVLRE
jgi:hypothetical protein